MPVGPHYQPDPRYPEAVGAALWDKVRPASFPKATLRFRNDCAAASLGLEGLDEAEWLDAFWRFKPLAGQPAQPLALRYHGHQFQSYNPNLGDGRGFLFAQMREAGGGRLLDLTTKGSGTTPWSRGGDGRLTLQGAVREILAAELLEARGVPTCRILSVVETGEGLQRHDEPSPTRAGVMVRVQWSSVRYGSFQRLAWERDRGTMQRLLDWCIEELYPELADAPDRPAALLAAVSLRAADTLAGWMSAGFVHGVLNTDNMDITGESFDYGPFRFLPTYDPSFVAAYFDHSALYAYGRQPRAVFWNLHQLAEALALIGEPASLARGLDGFEVHYRSRLRARTLHRLGLVSAGESADQALLDTVFEALARARFPLDRFFHDWYGGAAAAERARAGRFGKLYGADWFAPAAALLSDRAPLRPVAAADAHWAEDAPVSFIDDHTKAVWAAIAERDDWAPLAASVAAARRVGALLEKVPEKVPGVA